MNPKEFQQSLFLTEYRNKEAANSFIEIFSIVSLCMLLYVVNDR